MNGLLRLACAISVAMLLTGEAPAQTDERQMPMDWTAPIKPFRIAGNVYYVGTRGLAAYLIDTPKGAILIDGTLEQNAELIERNIEAVGVPLRKIRILLSDHAHYDHVGALARIQRDSGATFYASAADRRALEDGLPPFRGLWPSTAFPPIKVDHVIADGEHIRLGDADLTVVPTPGHTPGCTSYRMTVRDSGRPLRLLFLCSITVAANRLAGRPSYPGIVDDYRATFGRLDRIDADIVLTSHPEVADVVGRGRRNRDGGKNAFVNPNLLSKIVQRARSAFRQRLAADKIWARRHGKDEDEQ